MNVDRAVIWMAEHGHPEYANKISILEAMCDELIGDAGRYWQHCEFTQGKLARIRGEIAEIKLSALDRYEDWATD